MSKDWLNKTDDGLRAQAGQFSTYLTANAVALGLVAGDATALATNVATYVTKLGVVENDSTRTKVTTAEKDTAKDVLVANLRSLGRRIQANPNVTDSQKVALTLPVRDAEPSPVPAPVTRPAVSVIGVAQWDVAVRAVDETTPLSRSKPAGAVGLQYFSWVSTAPAPEDLELWRFEGIATKSDFVISYNLADAGKPITIVARWMTRKGEVGPTSQPVTTALAIPLAA
jgi:hypothetical protein